MCVPCVIALVVLALMGTGVLIAIAIVGLHFLIRGEDWYERGLGLFMWVILAVGLTSVICDVMKEKAERDAKAQQTIEAPDA